MRSTPADPLQFKVRPYLKVGFMEGVEELAALARQHISEGGALSTTEGFSYS